MAAQSKDLATETGVMRKIEAAFRELEELPEKARTRVLRWAQEVHLNGDQPSGGGTAS